MTDDEYDMKMYEIHESYTAEDIGEIDGEEGIGYWNPDIDGTRIESCVNLDIQYPYFRYIRSISDDEYGKICRIRIDKPEYVYHKGDTILTKQELKEMISIFKSARKFNNEIHNYWEWLNIDLWNCYKYYNGNHNKPIIPPMPDYSKLETSD